MRLSDEGYPCIILSHRRAAFLEDTVASLRAHAQGITDVIVVDDSGSPDHHDWLLSSGYKHAFSSPNRTNVGYLGSMQTVWEVARSLDAEYVLLWEEDFHLTTRVDVEQMACVVEYSPTLAQLNLQRQAVYKIERRVGYIESHARRGYGVRRRETEDIAWIERCKPFTTNPSLVRSEVFKIDWPTRAEADQVAGGAEPAMSLRLEQRGYTFGWLGQPNKPQTRHVGIEMKSGRGY